MKSLHIAPGMALPLDAVTQTMAIIARRGAGKTHTAVVLAEEMLKAHLQVVVIDPLGVWWGLRSSFDGKSKGFPVVVFGGDHGDVPLTENMGAHVADVIVSRTISAVLDVSTLSKSAARRFGTAFAERLYEAKQPEDKHTPLHLFVDEADMFCMSADTEILTEHGWKGPHAVSKGMRVQAYDPISDTCALEPIRRVIHREYDGEMVLLKTKSVDCLVTPDHRVVLQRTQRAKGRTGKYPWTFCRAEDAPCHIGIPGPRFLNEGGQVSGADPEIMRVIGWVIADGNIHDRTKGSVLSLCQSLGTRKRGVHIAPLMKEVLERLGASVNWRPARQVGEGKGAKPILTWYFRQKLSDKIHRLLGGVLQHKAIRRVPRCLIEQSSFEQLEALYLGLLEGDGTSVKGRWTCFYPGVNEGLADDLQEIATRLGITTTKGYSSTIGQWYVSIRERPDHTVRRPAKVQYKGLTWDITVDSGAFVARRNGRIFVTGNCPQRVQPDQARMLSAFEMFPRRGRNRGFGVTVITQRPATINKDVLTQAEVLITLQITGTQDRKAVLEWVEGHDDGNHRDEFLKSLAGLQRGQAWVWSPSWLDVFKLVQIRQRETYNSSATPTAGQTIKAPKELAPVDLERLRADMATVLQEAEKNDPAKLKARIAELERALKAAAKAPAPTRHIAREDLEQACRQVEARLIKSISDEIGRYQKQVRMRILNEAGSLARWIDETAGKAILDGVVASVLKTPMPAARAQAARASAGKNTLAEIFPRPLAGPGAAGHPDPKPYKGPMRTLPKEQGGPGATIVRGARLMLTALAQAGKPRNAAYVGAAAGLSSTSGTFGTYLGSLRSQGLIEGSGDELRITAAGIEALGAYEPLPTGQDLIEMWCRKVGGGAARILRAVAAAYPNGLTAEEVGQQADISHTSGTFGTYIGKLRTLCLIERRVPFKATAELMGDG